MAKLRIVIGDDHTIVRQGLRKILEERAEWEHVLALGSTFGAGLAVVGARIA